MHVKYLVAALLATSCLTTPALAQSTTVKQGSAPASTAASSESPADTVAVPVWPKVAVELPETPVAASFSLGRIEGVPPELLAGVTAKGYARKVAVENQSIGQVLVVSVAKGDREESISTEGLTAQFDAKDTSRLFPEKTVEVQGSKTALVAALQRLAAPAKKEEEKKPATDPVSDNKTSNSPASSNDLAAGYKTPTPPAAAPEEKAPVTDTRTTREGCPVRIDLPQETAFQQNKVQTFTDGTLTNDGECTDGAASYPLKKSYLSCPSDAVDVETLTAWPQFKWYYLDDAGENHSVGECVKDTDTAYTITEDESQCRIDTDFVAKLATPQSALVYIGRNNALTQVPGHGCGPSTKSQAVPMIESLANCPMRPDFVARLSYERSMWTYLRDGVTYQAATCADTGRTFPHVTVYVDSGGKDICPVITNLNAEPKTVTLQSRKQIVVDGVPQYITECTPDTANRAVLPTTDGCMDPSKWVHDLEADISYGQERFYWIKPDGSREYVTQCQTSTQTYPHDITITGYQPHDNQLWAYPLTTVTIQVGTTPYTVASSTVLPGAPQLSYILEGTIDQPTGNSDYDGCNAYRETAKYERWTRPDGSEYLKQVGLGTPTGPVNVCVSTVIDSRTLQTGTAIWTCSEGGSTTGQISATINKTQVKNTENGITQSTICAFASSWNQNIYWNGPTTCTTYFGGVPALSSTTYNQTLNIPPCPF